MVLHGIGINVYEPHSTRPETINFPSEPHKKPDRQYAHTPWPIMEVEGVPVQWSKIYA